MAISRSYGIAVVTALLGQGFLSAHALAQARPAQDLSAIVSYSGPDRTDRLLAEARKEGGATLYSSATVADMAAHLSAFEQKYGLKITLWRGDSEGIAQRAITEARSGRFAMDLVETSGGNLESMHREGLLQAVNAPMSKATQTPKPARRRDRARVEVSGKAKGIKASFTVAAL